MKKKILTIIVLSLIFFGVTSCGKKNQDIDKQTTEALNTEVLQCLESELGGYLVTENDDLIEIPLSEIIKDNQEKISYFKGFYASHHPDNIVLIVYPKNGTYDFNVMKDFDKYFYEKFSVYQMSESLSTPTIYFHNPYNDVDFKEITNKCVIRNNSENGKLIPPKTLDKINNTTKIVIKSNQKELGTITDKDKLTKILDAISSSKQYGNVCLADGYGFEFDMYENNKLIDTIYIWGDGKRLIPASMSGCYYSISNGTDLRKIIEEETDYVFYNILDFREDIYQTSESLIYKDNQNSYYLNSKDSNEILIKFMLNNQIMTLKYALENKYISAEKVAKDYPDILISKEKEMD